MAMTERGMLSFAPRPGRSVVVVIVDEDPGRGENAVSAMRTETLGLRTTA